MPASRRACAAARRRRGRATRRRASPAAAPTRARTCTAAGVQSSAASLDARTRATSAAVVAAPGSGGRTLLVETEGVEPSLDANHEVVAIAVPLQADVLGDVVEHAGDLVRLDRGAETDPRARPLAVEIGGDEERRRRQRVVVGDPRPGAGAELELPVAAAAGEPVREAGEQQQPGAVRVDRVEVEPAADAPGDVGGPVADPTHRRPIGTVVARVPAHDRHAEGEVGRERVGPAAQHVALVDDGGDHTRRRERGAGDDARQPRVQRERNHRPPDVGEARRPLGVTSGSIAPSNVSSSTAARHARVGGGSAKRSAPGGAPHAASSRASPPRSTSRISAVRCAGRVPCSIRDHSR